MENWIQRIFLMLLASSSLLVSTKVVASDNNSTSIDQVSESVGSVFEPKVERREVKRDAIDTENWEIGFNYGVISIEDFGTSEITSMSLAYHVTEDFFMALNYGKATAGESSIETITGIQIVEEPREYVHYNFALGYNLLPGEGFVGETLAFTSAFYFLAGLGTTEFANNDYSTVMIGGGYQVLFNDWLAMNVTVKDHFYDTELLGTVKTANDLEVSTGFTIFF